MGLPKPTYASLTLACVLAAKGSKVSWAELFARYRRRYAKQDLAPLDAASFGRRLDTLRSEGSSARGGKARTFTA